MIGSSLGRAERNMHKDFSNLFGQGARERKLHNLQLEKLEQEMREAKKQAKMAKKSRPRRTFREWLEDN